MTDHAKQAVQLFFSRLILWVGRLLFAFVLWYANQIYSELKELTNEVSRMRVDVEVMKKQVELLTDYNIDPKNTGR